MSIIKSGKFKKFAIELTPIAFNHRIQPSIDGVIRSQTNPTMQGMYVSLSRLTPFTWFVTNRKDWVSLERLTYSFSSNRRSRPKRISAC